MINAYIISYLGQGDRADIRYAHHQQQLNQLVRDPRINHIYILCQDYVTTCGALKRIEDLCPHNDKITYIHDAQQSPAQARNKLLRLFYEEHTATWGHFADNDAMLDYRYDGERVFDWLLNNILPNDIKWLTCMSPRHQPFSKYLTKIKNSLQDLIPIHQSNYLKTTMFWVKQDSTPIYFDEHMPEMEDTAMLGEIIGSGMLMYQFKSVIMNDLGLTTPVLFTGHQARMKNMADWKQYIIDKYTPQGLKTHTDKNGKLKLNWEAMIIEQQPMNVDRRKILFIPRSKTWGNGLFQET